MLRTADSASTPYQQSSFDDHDRRRKRFPFIYSVRETGTRLSSSIQSASAGIEKFGFLPNKILPQEFHKKLIELAEAYKIETSELQTWLSMRSVTFTQNPDHAIRHIEQGSAGGQGLKNITAIIEALPQQLTEDESTFIDSLKGKINVICSDQPVIYIVDLTNLGPRLDPDRVQPFYYYRWHPEKDLPEISEIGPERILMKLAHKVSSL